MSDQGSIIKRPRLVLATLFLVGLAVLVVGWRLVPNGQFLEGLLVEIGGGILLFTALLLLERHLIASFEATVDAAQEESRQAVEEVSERVGQVEESVEEVRSEVARLGDLGDQTAEAIAERQAEVQEAFQTFAADVSPRTISRILREAERIDAVDPNGVRIQIPDSWLRLRIRRIPFPGPNHIVRLIVEEFDGTEVGTVHWGTQAITDAIVEVVEVLQARGEYTGSFPTDHVFAQFRDTVETAVELKTARRPGPRDIAPVTEMPNNQWVVTTEGIQCLERNYPIDKTRLGEDDWSRHMYWKTWVDHDKFMEAYDIAKAIWDREERERIEEEETTLF